MVDHFISQLDCSHRIRMTPSNRPLGLGLVCSPDGFSDKHHPGIGLHAPMTSIQSWRSSKRGVNWVPSCTYIYLLSTYISVHTFMLCLSPSSSLCLIRIIRNSDIPSLHIITGFSCYK